MDDGALRVLIGPPTAAELAADIVEADLLGGVEEDVHVGRPRRAKGMLAGKEQAIRSRPGGREKGQ